MSNLDALAKHIISGSYDNPEPGVPSSEFSNPDFAGIHPDNPASAGVGNGIFTSQDENTIDAQNRAQAYGLDSGDGRLGEQVVDLEVASKNYPSPQVLGSGSAQPVYGTHAERGRDLSIKGR